MAAPWAHLPRVTLTALPTPLTHLPRFSEAVGADVFMKRDDVGSLGLAGNKVRKLEFVLGEARERGANAIVIVGAEQSNAARAAAAACAQLGTRCVLVLSGDEPEVPAGNLLLDRLFGAEVRFAGTTDWAELARVAEAVETELREQGATPYRLPAGASSPLGAVAFAAAWFELLEQLEALGVDATTLIHSSSSGGTHAGLVTGRHLSGRGPAIRGVLAADDIHPDTAAAHAELIRGAGALLGMDIDVQPDRLWLDARFLGEAYGTPTPEGVEAIRLLARTEAIVCDPVYSGKALAALVASARAGELDGPTVFWHTGGYHALFAPRFARAVVAPTYPGSADAPSPARTEAADPGGTRPGNPSRRYIGPMRLAIPAIVPALLTPFDEAGEVDREALAAHVSWLIERGVDGLMPCGTTGETALLSDAEVIEVVETVVTAADGRVPVIAHVGRPGTRPTIELGRRALDAGAAAVSAVVPYYHQLTPSQVLGHYRAVMAALGADRVFAYSIPSHSNNDLDPDGLATLAREGLAGFKDSTMSAERHDQYMAALAGSGRNDFRVLVGKGALLVRSLRAGSAGAVLGIANLHPEIACALRDAVMSVQVAEAERLQTELAEAEEALSAFPDLKRAVAERVRSEAGIDYGPHMRAPLGAAGSAVAEPA